MKALLPLPPFADLTPNTARLEFQKARYLLSSCDGQDRLEAFASLTKRFAAAEQHGLLFNEDIRGRMWDAAEVSGLVNALGVDRVQEVLGNAMRQAADDPDVAARRSVINATPYSWTEASKIPMRDWLYGRLLIRKFVSATVAPGGVGKTSLTTAEALAMAAGRDLLETQSRQLRVWLWNLEDPQEETTRKIQATACHYGLSEADIGGRLFVDSGREQRLVLATQNKTGFSIAAPTADGLISEVKARSIDVLIIDPFVSCHEANENDNSAMDRIAKEWGRIADQANCAVHLVHHTRKMGGGVESEVTTDTARGGKALTDACRVVRAVNRMTKDEASKAGVENHRLFFRTINDKANLAPPVEHSDWCQLISVPLGNGPAGSEGDHVGVVTAWRWPDHTAGLSRSDFEKAARVIRGDRWRADPQAAKWVGIAVAQGLELDLSQKLEWARVRSWLKMWIAAGSLRVVDGEDEKRNRRKFVEVADSIDD